MPVPDQPLVGEGVDLGSPPIDHSVSEEFHAHVLLISLDSPESENNPPIPTDQGGPPSVPIGQGAIIWFPHQVVR